MEQETTTNTTPEIRQWTWHYRREWVIKKYVTDALEHEFDLYLFPLAPTEDDREPCEHRIHYLHQVMKEIFSGTEKKKMRIKITIEGVVQTNHTVESFVTAHAFTALVLSVPMYKMFGGRTQPIHFELTAL